MNATEPLVFVAEELGQTTEAQAVLNLKAHKDGGATVFGLQNMYWPEQWKELRALFPFHRYGKHPWNRHMKGSAEVIVWDRKVWKRIKVRTFGEDFYCNVVLLKHRDTGSKVWFKNVQQTIYPSRLEAVEQYVRSVLKDSGYPVFDVNQDEEDYLSYIGTKDGISTMLVPVSAQQSTDSTRMVQFQVVTARG